MSKAQRWAALYGIVCLLGAVVSFASYSGATSLGGQYVVFGGAIVFGFIGFVRALVHHGKLKGSLVALQGREDQRSGKSR